MLGNLGIVTTIRAATGNALLSRVKHNQPTLHAALAVLHYRVPLRLP